MGLSVKIGSFALNTVTGNQSVSDVGFQPKVVIFLIGKATADDTWSADAQMCVGFATSSTDEYAVAMLDQDAIGSADTCHGMSATACMRGFLTAATPTLDFECDFVSMDAGGFTFNVSNAPATALRVNYIALGGTSLLKAKTGTFAPTLTATQDITVESGWGQPSLVLFAIGRFSGDTGGTAGSAALSFGGGKSATENQCVGYHSGDAAGTMNTGSVLKANAMYGTLGQANPAADMEATLSAVASWPADGFEITYADQAGATSRTYGYLALQFDTDILVAFGKTTSEASATTETLTPSPALYPLLAFFMSDHLPSHAAIDTGHADGHGMWVGATDGTVHRGVNVQQDDANTNSVAKNGSMTKAIVLTAPGSPPADKGVATVAFVGQTMVTTWAGRDATARDYSWLVIGSSSPQGTYMPRASGVNFQDPGVL